MRTALYIENQVTQIVLTPENEFEKAALASMRESPSVQIKEGGFYHCQGGWHRESGSPDSTMLVCQPKQIPAQ